MVGRETAVVSDATAGALKTFCILSSDINRQLLFGTLPCTWRAKFWHNNFVQPSFLGECVLHDRHACSNSLACHIASHRPDAYQRLRDLVYSSPHIDPEYVLAKLPPSSLLEIRALMLERLGRHREALTLYVHGLKDLQLAEAYCDRVYAAAAGVAGKGGGLLRGRGPAKGAKGGAGRMTLGEEPADIYTELVEVGVGWAVCPLSCQGWNVAPAFRSAAAHSKACLMAWCT